MPDRTPEEVLGELQVYYCRRDNSAYVRGCMYEVNRRDEHERYAAYRQIFEELLDKKREEKK